MQLHEIKDIYEGNRLYENLMASDELLDEGAKELFAAGKKKLGQAAEKLKDAVDAPAQKAWAEVQSRLATAGKDDAIGKLKDFASKHKVAIGTLAIIGAGLLTATDASAGDAMASGAGIAGDAMGGSGGDAILNAVAQQVQQAQGSDVAQQFMQAMSTTKVDGMSIQDFAAGIEQQAGGAANKAQAIKIQQDGVAKIIKATLQSSQQVASNAQDVNPSQNMPGGGSQYTNPLSGRKVNFGKGVTDTIRGAVNTARGS